MGNTNEHTHPCRIQSFACFPKAKIKLFKNLKIKNLFSASAHILFPFYRISSSRDVAVSPSLPNYPESTQTRAPNLFSLFSTSPSPPLLIISLFILVTSQLFPALLFPCFLKTLLSCFSNFCFRFYFF